MLIQVYEKVTTESSRRKGFYSPSVKVPGLYIWCQGFPLLMGLPQYLADNFSSNSEKKKKVGGEGRVSLCLTEGKSWL